MAKDAVSESGLPRTLIVSLTIGPACWLMPHQGAMSTLLPQRLNDIAPDEKVSLMVMFSSTAMVVALFSNIILGALSDRTRSRFGKRKPWIIVCSVLSCVVLVMFGQTSSVAAMLVWWCLYELVVNGVAAAMVAQLSDRVPERWRGTVSSAYGIGSMVGNQLGILIAAQFLGHVNVGINILAAVALCGGIASALLAGEAGNVDEPRPVGGAASIFAMFLFPTHHAARFYMVLAGRFAMTVSTSMVSGYMLYILQDYLGLGTVGAARLLSINSSIALVVGLICCVTAGPLCDRIGHVYEMTAATTVLIGIAALIPFIMPTPLGIILFSLVSGIGSGANSSLIQTVSVQVLPNPDAAAKDLGFLNLSNTLGSVCGSFMAAGIIGLWGYGALFAAQAVGMVISAACIFRVRNMAVSRMGG